MTSARRPADRTIRYQHIADELRTRVEGGEYLAGRLLPSEAELSQQYILSYYPDDEADKRGQFRSITLAIHGKPNYSVRTRNGYYVPKK